MIRHETPRSSFTRPAARWGLVLALGLCLTPSRSAAQESLATLPILLEQLLEAAKQTLELEALARSARESLSMIREYTGYARDAHAAYQEITGLTASQLESEIGSAFLRTFPEVQLLKHNLDGLGELANEPGSGELQRRLARCLRYAQEVGRRGPALRDEAVPLGPCDDLLSAQRLEALVQAIYGEVPEGTDETDRLRTTDAELARAQARANGMELGVAQDYATVRSLLAACRRGRDPAACQAAKDLATMLAGRQRADTNALLAEVVRLTAEDAAAENADRKRELRGLMREREQIREGLRVPPPHLELRFPGEHLTEPVDIDFP